MRQFLLHITLLLSLAMPSFAQRHDNRFQYTISSIGTSEGLPQNDVNRIMVDNNNFVWMATNDGVGYFDGDNFSCFRAGERGLTSNIFIDIAQDKDNNIYLLSVDKGLFLFDPERLWFNPINIASSIKITEVECDRHNNVWLRGSNNSLHKLIYNPAAENPYSTVELSVLTQKIEIDYNGELLIKYNNTIHRPIITPVAGDINSTMIIFNSYTIEGIDYIHSLCASPNGELYALSKNTLYSISLSEKKATPLMPSNARSIFISKDNGMLLSSAQGILYKDLKEAPQTRPTLIMPGNITVTHITEDHTGTLWAGTFRGGAIKFEPRSTLFRSQVTNSSVEALFEDSAHNIWVGSIDGSVNILKRGSSQLMNLRSAKWVKPPYMVAAICEHSLKDRIYISAGNAIYSTAVGNFDFRVEKNMSNIKNVRSMLPDGKYMWLASYSSGLILYDMEYDREVYRIDSEHRSSTLEVNIVRSIMKDSNSNIWFGTQNGLYRIDAAYRFSPAAAKATRIEAISNNHSLSSSYVIPIIEDHKGDIWVGTLGAGLFVLDGDSERRYADYRDVLLFDCQHLNAKDGLTNNNIKSLVEDDHNNIWASSNNGVYKIDSESYKMLNYGIKDGLLDSEYCELAGCKLSNGEVALGSVKGYNTIDPAQMSAEPVIPSVAIVQMILSNKVVEVGEAYNHNIVLEKSLLYTKKIDLKHNQNSFTFRFSSPRKAPYGNALYQYKLEGFDEDWVNCIGNSRSASYTNLSPRDYRFVVRTSNDGDNWSPERAIDIEIIPSLWVRWYMILLYMALLIGSLSISVRQYQLYIRNRNRIFIVERERNHIKRLTKNNLEIFSNVSHELRTPLTLIISNLQRLIENHKYSSEQQSLLQQISDNSSMLLRLTNNLLDFTKREHKSLNIDLQYGELVNFCSKIVSSFDPWASSKEITIESQIAQESIHTLFDVNHMESILYNLLSNAVKYSAEGGKIIFEIGIEESLAVIRVSNSGEGIDEKAAKNIFSRYYSSATSYDSGTGIGLTLTKSLVEMHNGTISLESHSSELTTFAIKLPIVSRSEAERDILSSPFAAIDEKIGEETEETTQQQFEIEPETLIATNRHSILIIDDNQPMLQLLEELFAKEMQVYTADNARDGYQMCLELQPSIVLSDVMMPEVSGIELCRMIKEGEESYHIPVVLLTADAISETQAKGLDAEADAFCTKPFDNRILLSTIRSIVTNRERVLSRAKENPVSTLFDASANDADNEFIEQVVSYIEQNAAKTDFSVEKICNDLDIIPQKLTKRIKEITGQTVIVFIKRVKLRKAAKMLSSAKYTVAEATYASGFNDLKHFRTIFKAEFGVLPNDFANKYKPKH